MLNEDEHDRRCAVLDADVCLPISRHGRHAVRARRQQPILPWVNRQDGAREPAIASKDRSAAPSRVLIDLRWQFLWLNGAWIGGDQFVRHGIFEHPMQDTVDMAHCSRGKLFVGRADPLSLRPRTRARI